MHNCTGLAGRLFGHKFVPRFDTKSGFGQRLPDHIVLALGGLSAANLIEAEKDSESTYVYDICVRCGTVVRRTDAETK